MNTFDPKIRAYWDTVKICETLHLNSPPSVKYNSIDIQLRKLYDKTTISVKQGDCLDIAYQYLNLNPVVLNMADDINPGGTVKAGGGAQEEELFRRTSYHRTLTKDMYPIEGVQAIYSPKVHVFKSGESDNYTVIQHVLMDFIACPAPRSPQVINKKIADPKLVEEVLEKIRLILKVAYVNGNRVVVLSAWGCGAFSCPPEHMAELFKSVLKEFDGMFKEIIFAIKKGNNYHVYKSLVI